MSALQNHYKVLLEEILEKDFVPHLPPLLDQTKPLDQQQRKNLSRAFSAFALHKICAISPRDAAQSVIDDFDDDGIDAIYFHASTDTLYLLQSKFKAAEQFKQDEALACCQGIRKLIRQDLSNFNKNVQDRQIEVEDAIDRCNRIQLVVAHIGSGISYHAKLAIQDLFSDRSHGEDRLETQFIDYNSDHIVRDLLAEKAHEKVNTALWLQTNTSVDTPRVTYFGLVQLEDLVKLHQKHAEALYARNIRTFLGHKTGVNASIQQTLSIRPQDFLYLNNGVTALCEEIIPKGPRDGKKRFEIKGFSVINGAQTIAASAKFLSENPNSDISAAKVTLTLIKADSDEAFGKIITRARNHQNPIHLSNFVALDDEQERLRREIAYLGIHYAYKPEEPAGFYDPSRIRVEEAAQALAILESDPRYVVWLRKEPTRFLDTDSDQYKSLFTPSLTAFRVVNAVRMNRYILERMNGEAESASGLEKFAYKKGSYAIIWVLSKQLRDTINSVKLLDEVTLRRILSAPYDDLRQTYWNQFQISANRGQRSLFINQTNSIPFLQDLMITHYGLGTDLALQYKLKQPETDQPYPKTLFDYLVSKAPQIPQS